MISTRRSLQGFSNRDNLMRDNKMSGSGIFSTFKNAIPNSDSNARPGFPGENHAILQLPNGLPGIANYMGPGTNIIERLKRGDPPRTNVDRVAMRHDIDYQAATMSGTIQEQRKKIREADLRMLKKVGEIQKDKSDSNKNITQAKLIAAKVAHEDAGLMSKDKFSGKLVPRNEGIISLLNSEKAKLAQQGYGLPSDPIGTLKKLAMKQVRTTKKNKTIKKKQTMVEQIPAILPTILKGSGHSVPLEAIKSELVRIVKKNSQMTGLSAKNKLTSELKKFLKKN